ncbi:MAG: sulfite exporter TauE/SafE family protein [Parvibaculaceae bacterium]|nr:sulfite exporter TauE/SafE family protein [Parvibaculaceae bacterium]
MDLLAGYSTIELIMFAVGLLATGIIAGVIAGLLGVGGGIVIVPVLFHIFTTLGIDESIRMHLAVGTSLGTIIPTSIRSVRAHHKKGAVDWALLKRWALPMLLGVIVGTVLASYVNGQVLTAIFAVFAIVIAANLAFGREEWRLGDELPSMPAQSGIAAVIGGLSSMMGIGGGTFGVTTMTLFGRPIHNAVATSAGLGLIISVPGAIGFLVSGWAVPGLPPFSIGYVNLIGLALIVPMTVLAAPWGAALAHKISRKTLARAFAFFLLVTSIKMMMGLFA